MEAVAQELPALSLGNGISIMASVNYVSSASIQLNAFSSDPILRSMTEDLSGGYGYGISIRKTFFREDLSFGFSTEYLRIIDQSLTETFESPTFRVKARVKEDIWMLPVEFSGYFNLPKFTENLKIYLGGGVGMYFGDRKRTLLNLESKTIYRQASFSFLVLSGMEYNFTKKISGVFEMKFREGEFQVKSQFPFSAVNINGEIFPIQKNLNSKIFVDGLKLSLGVAYNF